MVCPADREQVKRGFAGSDSGTDYCEYRIQMADGGLKWVYNVRRVVTDTAGKRWCYAVITDIDGQKQAESGKLFETYGKAIAGIFDEVTDLDYGNDVAVLLHSHFNPQRVGVPFHDVRQALERCTDKWGMDADNRERYLHFVRPDRIKELYLEGRVDYVELQDGKAEWYRSLLLPLNESRCLFCTLSITDEKRAETLKERSVRLEVIQDLLDQLPVGVGVFELDAEGHRKLCFLSQAGCRILHTTAEDAEAFFKGPDVGSWIPYLQDPVQLRQLLDSGRPQERRLTLHRQGTAYSVDMITNLVRNPTGITGYVAILDATDKVQAEHTQQWQRSLYRILTELPRLVAFDYDPKEDRMTRCVSLPGKNGMEMVIDGYMHRLEQQDHIAPETSSALHDAIRAALRGSASGTVDYQADYFGEGYRWCRAHYISLADEDGQVYRIVGRVDDVEDEIRREQALRELAQRDAMTGLLNHDASEQAIEAAIRSHNGGALFILDIDDFKQVNDMLGHLFGDTFLRQVADTIRSFFRSQDIVGRFGGDEFIGFLSGAHNVQLARRFAEDLVKAVKAIDVPELGQVRCSVGVAIGNSGDLSMHELFKRADFALYEAKHGGKGSYAVFQGEQKVFRMPEVESRSEVPETILDARPRMLAGDVFEILYHTGGSEEGIQQALAYVGRWMKVSRSYIFEHDPSGTFCSNTFEWCGEGETPQKEQLQHVLLSCDGVSLCDNFDAEGVFYCPDVSVLPQWQRDILEPQGIGAMLQWAFRWNGEIRGFVGFDICGETYPWVKEQVDSLVRASEVITVFLWLLREKEQLERPTDQTGTVET